MATAKAKSKAKVEEIVEVLPTPEEVNLTSSENDATAESGVETSVKQKLIALYSLQLIDSQIDRIRIIRGELPLEVQDLEDEVAGLNTRITNLGLEIEELKKQ